MNFGILTLTALCTFASFLSAFKAGDFVVISGLVKKPEYNGQIGLIQKTGERNQVLTIDGMCVRTFTPSMNFEDCFKQILAKEVNLAPVNWNRPVELSMEEVLENLSRYGVISSYAERKISQEESDVLLRPQIMISALCKDNPAEFKKPEVVEKLRLIGAWINQNYDFHAMVHVCEADRNLKNTIEWYWHGIGVWQH